MSSAAPFAPAQARLLSALVVLLAGWAIIVGSRLPAPDPGDDPRRTDLDLYSTVADRVASGEPYYRAAVDEQTARGYPVEPAATVRLPTTTYVNVVLGQTGAQWLLYALVGLVVVLALKRFDELSRSRLEWIASVALLLLALLVPLAPGGTYFSEVWAVALTLLAALLGPQRHPRAAFACVAGALLFRELALIFVISIAAWAWLSGHRRQAGLWLGMGATWTLGYLTIHQGLVADAVSTVASGPPLHSPGWLRFGGWPLAVDYVRRITPLQALPYWVSAVAMPLALLGWLVRRSTTTSVMLAAALGYMVAFMAIGRPTNAYWGLLYAPFVLPGLALAPRGIRELTKSALRGRAT